MMSGWSLLRLVTEHNDGALQVFYKRISRLAVVAWIPGGLAGRTTHLENSWGREIHQHMAAWITYIRIAFPNHSTGDIDAGTSWKEVASPISAPKTIFIDLNKSHDQLRSEMGPNWRRNLKRSGRFMLSVRTLTSDDSTAINHLEESVADYKQLKTRSPRHGGDTVNLFKQQALVLGVFDQESRLVSVRGAALFGDAAYDIVAATSPEGRRVYASYLATWSLLLALKDRNITRFDFSGIDDLRNKGVSDFKRGLGGKEVIYFPERHFATPRFMLPLAALLIRYRVQRSRF
jgi:hypothetical protein